MSKEEKNSLKIQQESLDVTLFQGQESGFEGTCGQTFKTPFLKILQALSPELKKSDPKYSSSSEQGQFFNTALGESYDSLDIVVLRVEHSLIVWKPDRKGFSGRFPKFKENEILARQEGLRKWTKEGDNVVDTIEFFCLDINNPSSVFLLSLSTTSLKYAKSFATRLRMLKSNGESVGVSWAGVWKIRTVEDFNDKGSWFTIGETPEFQRFVTKEEIEKYILPAKEMLKSAETDYTIVESERPSSSSENEEF